MNCKGLYEFEDHNSVLTLKRYLAADKSDITEVTIPPLHEGLPVLGIGFEAFAGARFLRSVVIPESVLRLGGGAFRGCAALESIRVPGSVLWIPAGAFLGCASLKRAKLCEGVQSIGANAFRDCASLESVTLPKSLRNIESCAFLGAPRLPAETVLMGLVRRPDLSRQMTVIHNVEWESALRPDVFALALKHNSFTGALKEWALFRIAESGPSDNLETAARAGLLDGAELTERLLERAVSTKNAETAAWLLEYKNSKFGSSQRGKTEITSWLPNLIDTPDCSPIERIINERFDL